MEFSFASILCTLHSKPHCICSLNSWLLSLAKILIAPKSSQLMLVKFSAQLLLPSAATLPVNCVSFIFLSIFIRRNTLGLF